MKKLFLALFLLLHFSTSIDAIEVTRHEAGLAGGTGTGNVVGPASSTDNAIPKYDGVTGHFLQNSGVILDDSNNISIPGDVTVSGSDVTIGAAGVKLTGDGDGAITFLGLGNGYDEDFTVNLDDVENTIGVSSSTGVTTFDFGTIGLTTTGTISATTLTGSYDPDLIAGDVVDDDKIDDVLIHFTTFAGAPTANDDSGDGYTVGWAWRNTTDGCLWVATDVTPTAAVWTSQCRPPLTQNYILVGNASGIAEATNTLPIVTFGNGATSSGYFYLLEDADNGTNKIKVEAPQSLAADLTLTLTGGYDTIYVDAAAMIPSTTSGALQGTKEYGTNDIDIDYFAFDAGATEERVQFKLKMPETWDLGTVKVKFDWTSDTGSTAGDTVEWGVKAGALSNDDAIDAALGTAQVITDTLLADNGTDLQTTGATPALTIGGTPALGDVIVFEVYRNTDGTDDMAEDAWLTGITIQYSLAGVPAAW